MSKLKTGIIASIATLGATAAGIAGVALIPSVKDNVSVSVNDKHVYGAEVNNDKLQAELTAEKEKVAELTATKTKNEKAISDLTSSNTELQTQVNSLTTEVNQKQETVTNLENEIATKNSEIQEKQETVNTLNVQIEANKARIAELEAKGETDSEEIANLTSANNSLNSQISNLNNEISTLNSDKENLNNQISSLNADIQVKTTEISNLNSTISTQETTISNLTNENTVLNNQIAGLNAEISNLQSEIDKYEQVLENYAVVTYSVDGTETIQIQDKNSTISFAEPTKEGFTFKGWALTEGGEIVADGFAVISDTKLYAVFEEIPIPFEHIEYWTFKDNLNGDAFYINYSSEDGKIIDSSKEVLCYEGVNYNAIMTYAVYGEPFEIVLFRIDDQGELVSNTIYSDGFGNHSKEIIILEEAEISFDDRLWLTENATLNNNANNAVIVNYVIDGDNWYILQEKGSKIKSVDEFPLGVVHAWGSEIGGANIVSSETIINENMTFFAAVGPVESSVHSFTFTEDDLCYGVSTAWKESTAMLSDFMHLRNSLSRMYYLFNFKDNSTVYVKNTSKDVCGYYKLKYIEMKVVIDGVEETVDLASLFTTGAILSGPANSKDRTYKTDYEIYFEFGCAYIVDIATGKIAENAYVSSFTFELFNDSYPNTNNLDSPLVDY